MVELTHECQVMVDASEGRLSYRDATRTAHAIMLVGGEAEQRLYVALCLMVEICPVCYSEYLRSERMN